MAVSAALQKFPVRRGGSLQRLALERAEEARHRRWVVAGARRDLLPHLVGLALLVAAVERDHAGACQLAELRHGAPHRLAARGTRGDPAERGEELHTRGPGLALGCVARGHVADLVADHVGELAFRVGDGERAPRNVDPAAGQREGVRLLHVRHGEAVDEITARRVARQALAEPFHVGPELGGVDQADLPLGRHERRLGAPRDGIRDTGREQHRCGDRRGSKRRAARTSHGVSPSDYTAAPTPRTRMGA